MQARINNSKTLLKILNVIKGKKRYLALLLLLQICFAVTSVGYAFFLRNIIDCAVTGNSAGIYKNVLYLAFLALFQFLLRLLLYYFDEFTRSSIENTLKKGLFANILTHDYSSVTAVHSGEWLNRLTNDTVIVADGLTHIFPGIAGTVIRIFAAGLFLLILIPQFAICLFLGGIFLIFFTRLFRKILKKLHLKVQSADDKLRVFLTEHLGALMVVKAYENEEDSIVRSEIIMNNHKKARMRKSNFSNVASNFFNIVMNSVRVLAALYCGLSIVSGAISFGTFTAVIQLISLIQAPFANISGYLPRYYSMIASAERVFEIEGFEKDLISSKISDMNEFYSTQFNRFGLKNAEFSYVTEEQTKKKVLTDININIEKGEFVAFSGVSGCGKSTVLKLFLSLYRLDSGEVYIGTENTDYNLDASFRKLFAYVPQGNILMNGTVRDVITFYAKDCDNKKLEQALKIACADSFVAELPMGVNTHLGERGAGLSEGQMQRLAIARAIYSGRPILLLDEATSALDDKTEAKLLQNLKTMTNKTVLIVTHRSGVLSVVDKTIHFTPPEEIENT